MAKVETEITIKMCAEELSALHKLLHFQINNPHYSEMSNAEQDLVNGIFFAVQDAYRRSEAKG